MFQGNFHLANGRMTVSNIFTRFALSEYLLGAFQQATAYTSLGTGNFRYQQYAAFVLNAVNTYRKCRPQHSVSERYQERGSVVLQEQLFWRANV